MKAHYHWGVENALVTAVTTALVFHGFRFLAARGAGAPGVFGKVSTAVGAVFTFGSA